MYQSAGIFITVDAEGLVVQHAEPILSSVTALSYMESRRAGNKADSNIDLRRWENYFVLDKTPEEWAVSFFRPRQYSEDNINLQLFVLSPNQYLAESTMRRVLGSKSSISAKELNIPDISSDCRRPIHYPIFVDRKGYKLFGYKVTREPHIAELRSKLSPYIQSDNIHHFTVSEH